MVLRRPDWKALRRGHRSMATQFSRAAIACLAPATLAVFLQLLSRALVTVPRDTPAAKPSRRHSLVLAGIAPSVPSLVHMPEALAEPTKVTREVGTNYLVTWPGDIGDDIKFKGGGLGATSNQYNVRVVYVAPGGVAAKAGVSIGDEVALIKRTSLIAGESQGYENLLPESVFRPQLNVDAFIKGQTREWKVGIVFRVMGMPQPGEQAPEFNLQWANGRNLSLADLRANGRRVVLFFRPGKQFFRGDTEELKVFKRVQDELSELNTNIAGITNCEPDYNTRQALTFNITYPLLADDGRVASQYGSVALVKGKTAGQLATDRKTFIIGADGRVEAVFPFVGWEANGGDFAKHIREITEVLDASEPQKIAELAVPKPKSMMDIAQTIQAKQR